MATETGNRWTLESFLAQLNSLTFFKEFTFAKNTFSPTPGKELELADCIIRIADFLGILQIKERNLTDVVDADSEAKWFENKVRKKATKQIRDSLSYLQEHQRIGVTNEQGQPFEVVEKDYIHVSKLVVYLPSPQLPDRHRAVKHHASKTAGFIHIFSAQDYLEVLRTLRVPTDVRDYLDYRQRSIETFGQVATEADEALLMGHFLSQDDQQPPAARHRRFLQMLVQDTANFDISALIQNLSDHIAEIGNPLDYYLIIEEFSRLPRSMWRAIKERFCLSVQKTITGEPTAPYRLSYPRTECGFLFVPTTPEMVPNPGDWSRIVQGLKRLTLAHKYDQKLSRCVGVAIVKDTNFFNLCWLFVESPWAKEIDMERRLHLSFPFRAVRDEVVPRFLFERDA